MSLCACCQRDSGRCRRASWVKAIEADGAADERNAVVAKLRRLSDGWHALNTEWGTFAALALEDEITAIERGEHRK